MDAQFFIDWVMVKQLRINANDHHQTSTLLRKDYVGTSFQTRIERSTTLNVASIGSLRIPKARHHCTTLL
jgi:hypothetical protein